MIIGKFMPVHYGHMSLIDFAVAHCDELLVSMSYTDADPIHPEVRFEWLKEIYKDTAHIKIERVKDDFDDESLPLHDRIRVWADVIKKRFPKIDIVFSSEPYGQPLATHLEAQSVSFDPERKLFPVSASMIRDRPLMHWKYLPPQVRPYYVKKVCLYGPESTGKTEMAKRLARHYNTEFVPEVAREMITSNDFALDDIIKIGKAQTFLIKEKCKSANKILFCDTDLITTQIYAKHYLHVVPPVLYELEKEIQFDVYFLFDIDVPWVADGLRDLGDHREQMAAIFKSELIERKIPYHLVQGTWEERFALIVGEMDKLLN